MSLKARLSRSLNEKDVENTYRAELLSLTGSHITSPYAVDGLLEAPITAGVGSAGSAQTVSIRTLLEFKYSEHLKNKLAQSSVLVQCLYYLKKFETDGQKLPTTIFVGDTNECFAIHTNAIVKYLSSEIDWKMPPSEAHRRNPALMQAMVGDTDILPFVFDVDDSFTIRTAIAKIADLSQNVVRKVRVTRHNVVAIFDYFDKHVLAQTNTSAKTLSTNEKANLFVQIITNPERNYPHPKKRNILSTEAFGELAVNSNLFGSFFQHFEGDLYSPREKEGLTSLVDRLVEDTVRRSKGEFFTPTPFVDLAHTYLAETFGQDWKEKYIVWDCAWGTGNLTRDFRFKELYCSTLEQSDLDTANQMGYNPEAVKFQYDFLNDSDDKLPPGLRTALEQGKPVLFLINPPYATASNMGTEVGDHKAGVADTLAGKGMKADKWGACSQNLYAQFLYRIHSYAQKNLSRPGNNVSVGIFCKPNYLSGSTYRVFREKFLSTFGYERGFLFQASHFNDVSTQWGINFAVFSNKPNPIKNDFIHDLVDFSEGFDLETKETKTIYNPDKGVKLSDWIVSTGKPVEYPTFSSALKIKEGRSGAGIPGNSFGTLISNANSVYESAESVYFLTGGDSRSKGKVFVNADTLTKTCVIFTARKAIKGDWTNDKDEYLAPDQSHPDYPQFAADSLVYSLFNNSSQQSSLRQVDYKGAKWDIKNEFFWLSKNYMMQLAEKSHSDGIYRDARTSSERFVYGHLFNNGMFTNESMYAGLSPDAKSVLDMATSLIEKSMDMRKLMAQEHPEYHLDSWDAGYAQLKLVWKEYFKDEFNAFRKQYTALEDRLRPLVYELGFLKKS